MISSEGLSVYRNEPNKALQPTPSRFAGWGCSVPPLAAHLGVGSVARSGWLSLTLAHFMTHGREQLWDFEDRSQKSIEGSIWIDGQCLDCDLCRETAPALFNRDEVAGQSFVSKQPNSEEELKLVEESISGCCTQAIHSDGSDFDWKAHPPRRPYSSLNRFRKWIRQHHENWIRGRISIRTRFYTYSVNLPRWLK